MAFTIKSHILFELNIWHHFFLDAGLKNFATAMTPEEQLKQLKSYNAERFLEVIPTPDTDRHLRNSRLLFVKTASGFICATTNVASDGSQPLVIPDEFLRLTFELRITDPQFFHYSQLDPPEEGQWLYYFNNLASPPTYQVPLSRKSPPAIGGLTYISNSFLLRRINPVFDYWVEKDTTVRVRLFDASANNTEAVLEQMLKPLNEGTNRQIYFQGIPSGWYRLLITNPEGDIELLNEQVYLNGHGFRKDTLGVVEIWCRKGADNYAILESDGTFKPLPEEVADGFLPARFEIRVQTRSVKWRYTDRGGNGQDYQTPVEYPLTMMGYIPVTSNGVKLPNPTPRHVKRQQNGTYIAEIFQS